VTQGVINDKRARGQRMDKTKDTRPALWLRILQFPPVRLVLLGLPLLYMLALSNGFMEKFAATPLKAIAVTIAMTALGFALYAGFVRFVERRPVSEFALPQLPRELGIGLLVGAGLYTGSVLVLMVLGVYRIEGLNPVSFMIPAIALALSSGVFEELLFRGALFRIVEEWLGSWISLVVSSFVFGFVHMLNPAATLTGALFISVEAGLLLAAAYMVTRRLWMSMGFHMAWNYTQSAVFSGIVSGGVSDPGLIKPLINGPDFLTGGSFGLEASVVAFVFCTGAGVVLLVIAVRRGNIVQPFWKRAG
jgi:membrane protease YdiL (CAAX protease family)